MSQEIYKLNRSLSFFKGLKIWNLLSIVLNLETRAKVNCIRTSDAMLISEQFIAIHNAQKDLGDIMKDITNKVKDVVIALML